MTSQRKHDEKYVRNFEEREIESRVIYLENKVELCGEDNSEWFSKMEANPQQHHRRNQRLNPNYEALVNLANNNVIHAMGGQFLIRQSKLLDIVLRLPPLFLMDQVLVKKKVLHFPNVS